jgi:hypothetical protein
LEQTHAAEMLLFETRTTPPLGFDPTSASATGYSNIRSKHH